MGLRCAWCHSNHRGYVRSYQAFKMTTSKMAFSCVTLHYCLQFGWIAECPGLPEQQHKEGPCCTSPSPGTGGGIA